MVGTDPYNAVIEEKNQVNPLLVILKVRPDSGELFPFDPGQFTTLGLRGDASRVFNAQPEPDPPDADRLITRTYSVCSTPENREWFEFYVRLVVGGTLSPRICDRQVGERLFLGPGAEGEFTLRRVAADRAIFYAATGTGMGPCMSMLREELSRGSTRPWVIFEGARYSWDLGYREELTRIAGEHAHVHYVPSITRVELDPDWSGPVGRLELLLGDSLIERETGVTVDPDRFDAFLCGNPGMIDAVSGWLRNRGFGPDRIHQEKYWPSPVSSTGSP